MLLYKAKQPSQSQRRQISREPLPPGERPLGNMKRWWLDYEDKIETLDRWESGARTISVRDIISKELILANVENRVPGKPVLRKCLLFKINYNKEGTAKLEAVLDFHPTYGQCKGSLVSKNKYLVILSNE